MTITLERLWEQRNQTRILIASAGIIVVIALADLWTLPYVSLGFLYLFPIMLSAAFLPRPALLALGILCAILSEAFSSLDSSWRVSRLVLEAAALAGCGLFVSELLRNRRLSVETQQRLRALVETSPAAIITIDESGVIELANHAAAELLVPKGASVVGQPIASFLPELQNALRPGGQTQFRTSMQSQAHRADGGTFIADVWFSTYRENGAPKLAAIIADVTEEQAARVSSDPTASDGDKDLALNSRQVAVLRLLLEGLTNSEIASRLQMTASSVNNTLRQLFAKVGVCNRSQMVRVALERYRDLLYGHPSDPASD